MDQSLSPVPKGKLSSLLVFFSKLEKIATVLRLEKIFKTCLLLAIRVYQQHISPYKGFSCAYRVLHQGQSCSSYFQSCITEQSFDRACVSLQQRLLDCHQANLILQRKISHKHRSKNYRRRRRNSSCSENNNCCNCGDLFDPSLIFFACNPLDLIDCSDCDF
ncbi:MAG: membrane protein insertion efficiency factor YidD [Cyanobacteria bacterium J06600_6]